ncbi:MAG: radical SAM protein [Candidatus Omnitrophica bacterium]|nr:radical SAM protein [Candidatus Omnitrophota bacterium]
MRIRKIILLGIVSLIVLSFKQNALARRAKKVDMERYNLKYVYGPVSSWRLGASLGIDPISQEDKTCSFDCFYCQIGPTEVFVRGRSVFVDTEEVIREVKFVLEHYSGKIDYLTFSGTGEPTLASNLGQIVKGIKDITSIPIAILTNATLLGQRDVQEDLRDIDFVIAKIDAYDEESFQIMNRPHPDLSFTAVIEGIKEFRRVYAGRMGIQIMFTQENKQGVERIAQIVKSLGLKPGDQIQLNTPLRPRVDSLLEAPEMLRIKETFDKFLWGMGLEIVMVYEAEQVEVSPIGERETLQRRGAIK